MCFFRFLMRISTTLTTGGLSDFSSIYRFLENLFFGKSCLKPFYGRLLTWFFTLGLGFFWR